MKKFTLTLTALAAALLCVMALSACGGSTDSFDLSVSASVEHGSVILTDTSAVSGEKVRLACMPDAGYCLKRYMVDGREIEGNTFEMPEKAVEVSAEFERIEYRIEYVLNGGTVRSGNPSSYNVESGDIDLIAPEKDGFEFGGWYYYFAEPQDRYVEWNDFKVEKIAANTTGKLTLYARYYNVPHEISVDVEELTYIDVYTDVYEAMVGETVTLSHNMYGEGHYFVCYTVDGVRIDGDSFTMPNRAVTVSAVIEPFVYTITYVLNGGDNSPDNPETYNNDDSAIELKPAVKEGFIFCGWYYIDEFGYEIYVDSIDGTFARDLTLYASFEPDEPLG